MSKSSVEQIKADEQKVVYQLIDDARQRPPEIAGKCGFSRQKVWRILNRLDKGNRVWGYTAVIDDNDDRNTYFALIKTNSLLGDIVDKIVTRLHGKGKADELEVTLLGANYLNGVYDWILTFSAKDIRVAKRFCGHIQREYDGYLERIDLMENVFPLIKFGKINPEIEKLKEFATN